MKKVLSLVLVLAFVLGMSVTSFAAKVDPKPGEYTGFSALIGADGQYVNLGENVAPGHSVPYTLATNAFKVTFDGKNDKDAEGHYNAATYAVPAKGNTPATEATYEAGYTKKALPKVVVRTRVAKGANVLDKVDITYNDKGVAQLEIKFVNPFKSNNPDGQEFDIWAFPVVDGKHWKYQDKGINFVGKLKNEVYAVDSATDYVDLYNGVIAKIEANVRNVEFDLGNDVSIFGKGYKSQKFWGRATQDVSEADLEKLEKYNIGAVYHLEVIGGLDKAAGNVVIKSASKADYIFDGELKFLGMGDSKTLPFAETYYIADHMIEVASEEEPIEDTTDEELDPLALPPVTGGTVSAPSGLFDNPSTGA